MSVIKFFSEKVDKFGPIHLKLKSKCWLWKASKVTNGYGQFKHLGQLTAHRVSYVLFIGKIPKGMHVLHKCDNKICVNPKHLFLGTHKQNMDDMTAKGRRSHAGTGTLPKGSKNGRAILQETDVLEIRKIYSSGKMNQSEIGRAYHVDSLVVHRVVRHITWNHI